MVDVLAFGAHPDDIEFGCGGILCKLFSQGRSITLVDLTLGERATFGSPKERKEEALKAAAFIQAERVCLEFPDCKVIDSFENRLEFVKIIRKYHPRLILAPYWKGEMAHPDHLACGLIARYAFRYSRFSKILPEIPIHTPEGILHFGAPGYSCPDFLIDVSHHIEPWTQMMQCHQSQMKRFDYIDWVLKGAACLGVMINKPYAQGLYKGNPIEVDDLMTVSKGTLEI